jgi:molecular chaperone GrpE (heat shock protein)
MSVEDIEERLDEMGKEQLYKQIADQQAEQVKRCGECFSNNNELNATMLKQIADQKELIEQLAITLSNCRNLLDKIGSHKVEDASIGDAIHFANVVDKIDIALAAAKKLKEKKE